MLGQRRFALIHITKHTTNINTWSINIIRTIRNIIIVIFINYLKIRLILRVRVLESENSSNSELEDAANSES